MIAESLGVAIEDLTPKKEFIKKCLEEISEEDSGSTDDDSIPAENEIREAAKKLSLKVDLDVTTFKKFMKLLEDEMGCENLTPAKSIIKQVYTDTKIIKGTRKLARSSKVDLENISNEVFFKMLQEMWDGIDLTPKKDLVFKTLEEYKRKHHFRVNNSMHTSDVPTSPTINVTKPNTLQNADEVMAMAMNYTSPENNNRNPTTIVGKPKCSLDLEEGCKVPEAAGLKWTDDFFDDDADDLVAVFDRKFMHMDATLNISSDVFIFLFSSQLSCTDDYDKMIQYGMTIIIANEIFPVFMIILGFVILTLYLKSLAGVFLLVLDLICLGLSLYGSYRVTNSYVRSLHLAVKRDGICFVQDNHLESFSLVAACRCCDSIYKVSKRSHTVSQKREMNFFSSSL